MGLSYMSVYNRKPHHSFSFGGDPGYTKRPLLYNEDGHIIIQYSRRHFTGYGKQGRSPNIPPITEGQAEALDALHSLYGGEILAWPELPEGRYTIHQQHGAASCSRRLPR